MKRFYVILSVFLLLFLVPHLVDSGFIIQLISMIGINVILSLGINILSGFTGQVSFGHAGFFGLGAYGLALLQVKVGLPWSVAMLLSVLITVVFALLIGMPILRLRGHFLGMATLAVGLLIYNISMQWISLTGGPDGMGIPDLIVPEGIWHSIISGYPVFYLILIFTLLAFIVSENIRNSKIGLAMRVVREDEIAAEALGLSCLRYKTIALVVSVIFSAVAGSLFASLNGYVNPDPFGLDTSIAILTMAVVGGMGSSIGALMGAVILTVLPQLIHGLEDYSLILYGVILIGVLVFRPGGVIPERPSSLGLLRND